MERPNGILVQALHAVCLQMTESPDFAKRFREVIFLWARRCAGQVRAGARTRAMLSGWNIDVDFRKFDLCSYSQLLTGLEAQLNGVADVRKSVFQRCALRNTAWQGGTLRNYPAVFIALDGNEKFHYFDGSPLACGGQVVSRAAPTLHPGGHQLWRLKCSRGRRLFALRSEIVNARLMV